MTCAAKMRQAIADPGVEAVAGYASVVSHQGFGVAFVVAASDLSEPDRLMTAHWQLDAAGYQRFSGALRSQGPRAGSSRTAPLALILMGDWCVPVMARHQTSENTGAYRSVSISGAAKTVVHENEKRTADRMVTPLDSGGPNG
jgi:hypothetical protein